MAESQVLFPYDGAALPAIRAAISDPRFATYMTAAGHDPVYALGLYLYNARLAKALLFPLQMVEVTLRNGVDQLLAKLFGADWPSAPAFRAILTSESEAALDKAITRATDDKGPNVPRGQIVATLTFDFWSNLFRPEYDRALWQVNIRDVLPNLPAGQTRADVQQKVKAVNRLRNRIAHHEPILGWDINGHYRYIVDLVEARCEVTAAWTKHYSTVGSVTRTKPSKQHARRPTVGEVGDPNFLAINGDAALSTALNGYAAQTAAIVRTNGQNKPTAALTPNQILEFMAQTATAQNGIIDLSDHRLDDVVAAQGLAGAWVGLHAGEPMAAAVNALRAAAVRVVVITASLDAGSPITGVIVRAHRRY